MKCIVKFDMGIVEGNIVRFLENYFDSRIFEQRKSYNEYHITTDEVEVEMSLEILTILSEQVKVVVEHNYVLLGEK